MIWTFSLWILTLRSLTFIGFVFDRIFSLQLRKRFTYFLNFRDPYMDMEWGEVNSFCLRAKSLKCFYVNKQKFGLVFPPLPLLLLVGMCLFGCRPPSLLGFFMDCFLFIDNYNRVCVVCSVCVWATCFLCAVRIFGWKNIKAKYLCDRCEAQPSVTPSGIGSKMGVATGGWVRVRARCPQ